MTKILVVDDEPMALKLVQSILEKRGFEVLVSTSPNHALHLFESEKDDIDLLISDVVMPEMDGPMLAKRIVEINPTLPVLFMSGFITESELEAAESITQYAFLRKPFRPQSLVQAVNKMLTGEGEIA